jgi:hypothetical protein
MSDENYTPEVIHAAFDEAHHGRQHWDFLYEKIGELPLQSLWDACVVFAKIIVYEGSVPDCIKGVDLNSLYDDTVVLDVAREIELLTPIQQWLSDQIVKSINTGEINSSLLGRFADGKIDPKRTYVDYDEIEKWLLCRGIDTDGDASNEFFSHDLIDALNIIHDAALSATQILKTKTYNSDFKIPHNDTREHDHLLFENARLRRQIDNLSNPQQSHKKTHGNAERFARNREQILGAAIHVITHWPEKCQNSLGKFEATKIAELIDSKSGLFWPDTGEPPLNRQKIEREISKWINSTVK